MSIIFPIFGKATNDTPQNRLPMNPKFIICCPPDDPECGTFVYGMVHQHKDLIQSRTYIRGGGWFQKNDFTKTMTLYGDSGDFGSPRFEYLRRVPAELKDYHFTYAEEWGDPEHDLSMKDIEWFEE